VAHRAVVNKFAFVGMHVVITGASSGIGEALTREYLRRGASLTLVARRKRKLEELAQGHAERCHPVEADLTDTSQACDWVDGAVAKLGPIDVLVNNAGVQIVARTVDTSIEDAERMLRLNVLSPFRLTKRVLPDMIAHGRGTIVDVSSIVAIAPTPAMFFYNASKAALAAASESLRGELRGTGVHVLTVYPGPVRTPMEIASRAAYEETALMRLLTPVGDAAVLARKIANGVASRRARIVYPASYVLARHFPNLSRFMLDRFTPPLKAAHAQLVEGKR
jgi:short-subunit dehydrogenase